MFLGNSSEDIDGRIMNWIRQQTAEQCLDTVETSNKDEHLPDEAFKLAFEGDHSSLKASVLIFYFYRPLAAITGNFDAK